MNRLISTIARRCGSLRQMTTNTFVKPMASDCSLNVASTNLHRSNAQELIARVPVIEVAADVAMCDGGGGATGHPIEFIKLDKRGGIAPNTCKYCGLRYVRKAGHHGHH